MREKLIAKLFKRILTKININIMKKILFLIALSVVMAVCIMVFLSVATLSLPTRSDLISFGIAYLIIDIYAICTGWHKKLWAYIIEKRPIEEEDLF